MHGCSSVSSPPRAQLPSHLRNEETARWPARHGEDRADQPRTPPQPHKHRAIKWGSPHEGLDAAFPPALAGCGALEWLGARYTLPAERDGLSPLYHTSSPPQQHQGLAPTPSHLSSTTL